MIQHSLKAGALKIAAGIAIVYKFFYNNNIVLFAIVSYNSPLICDTLRLIPVLLFFVRQAAVNVSELDVVPITVHGRRMDPEAIASELSRNKSVFLLTDDSTDLEGVCRLLEERGLARSVLALTDLGYPQERIERGSTASPPQAPGLSCVLIGPL